MSVEPWQRNFITETEINKKRSGSMESLWEREGVVRGSIQYYSVGT